MGEGGGRNGEGTGVYVLGGLRLPMNLISGVRCCSTAWRRMRVEFIFGGG